MRTEKKLELLVRPLARIGCFSIGTVYVLIGVFALLALFRMAAPAADEERIIHRLLQAPFGRAFIVAILLGMAGYVIWLLFEAIADPYWKGGGAKGIIQRIGIGLGSLVYGLIAWSAMQVLRGEGGHGESDRRLMVGKILEWPAGAWLVGAAGLAVIVVGLYQIQYARTRVYAERMWMDRLSPARRAVVHGLAWAGHLARCIILLVVGWFLVRAALTADPRAVGDTDSAFDFLGLEGGPYGDLLFSVVALGTIAYGLFMYAAGMTFKSAKDARFEDG